jgi:nucleotide-binding universal stress UspA family protein
MSKLERILVPLDGSPASENALEMAATLAEKFNSLIILLYVVELPALALPAIHMEEPPTWAVEVREYTDQKGREYLAAHQEKLQARGYRVETLLREMSPAEQILETMTSHDIDMVIMSTHGRGGLARWALGSVADKVVRHSPCPVLLIRQQPEESAS